MKIDSHHHLWDFTENEFSWIPEDQMQVRRDFTIKDFSHLARENEIDASVVVQAREILEETDMLLSVAAKNDLIMGAVGWVPLNDQTDKYLDHYSEHTKLKGMRNVLQGTGCEIWVDCADFNYGIKALTKRGLTYDILIYGNQITSAIELVDKHPEQRFVLDHIAKPSISDSEIDKQWMKGMSEISKRENVWCKLSGVVTEVNGNSWDRSMIRPYMHHTLERFGADRILFGSDWPVCLMASSYSKWIEEVESFIHNLSREEKQKIWSTNAMTVYKLECF